MEQQRNEADWSPIGKLNVNRCVQRIIVNQINICKRDLFFIFFLQKKCLIINANIPKWFII